MKKSEKEGKDTMALITQIQRSSRTICCKKRTVMEINYNPHIFSIWTAAAGAETGMAISPASIQLDRKQAECLRDYLNEFLHSPCQNT